MGTWGSGSFENDAALDWLAEVAAQDDLRPAQAVLSHVVRSRSFVDSDDAAAAIAAAEVVAAVGGAPPQVGGLPDELTAWIEAHRPAAESGLRSLALQALARVRAGSELRALWGASLEWRLVLDDLERRLELLPNDRNADWRQY